MSLRKKIVKLENVQESTLPLKYYLQVVKTGDSPQWPRPEEELIVGSQELGDGYTQHWAYPKAEGKPAETLPPAEEAAAKYPTPQPTILIDQLPGQTASAVTMLELILSKNGHAWSRTDSSLENLEDNISSLLDFALKKFDLKVEHFMTTERVSPEVEKKLDELEEVTDTRPEPVSTSSAKVEPDQHRPEDIKRAISGDDRPLFAPKQSIPSAQNPLAKVLTPKIVFPLAVVLLVSGGLYLGKLSGVGPGKLLAALGVSGQFASQQVEPTPAPSPTPSPTPVEIDKSQYQLRVLNGTTKSGAAAELAKKLEGLDWQILKVGNNSKQDVEQTTIRTKKDMEDVAQELSSDLGGDYDATTSADLEDSDKADIEVVIGKK